MSFKDWFSITREEIDNQGLAGAKFGVQMLYYEALRRLNPLFDDGENVYEHDWDLLILLDGCRPDAIRQIAGDYEFLSDPGVIRSVGSTSDEWMQNTFTREFNSEVSGTVYITANAHIRKLEDSNFMHLEKVYEWGWDEEYGTTPAEPVTDAAIKYGRKFRDDRDRMIVHYMQPHFPSIPQPIGHGTKTENAWARLWSDSLDEEELWNSYIANLEYVLDSVEILLNNIGAKKVIISADHSNAKGEWGVYEHPGGLPLRCLRNVPWYKTTAADSGERNPVLNDKKRDSSEEEISDQLRALGYQM